MITTIVIFCQHFAKDSRGCLRQDKISIALPEQKMGMFLYEIKIREYPEEFRGYILDLT